MAKKALSQLDRKAAGAAKPKKDKGETKKSQVLRLNKDGLTNEEIAKQVKTTTGSVRWWLSHAHQKSNRAVQEKANAPKKEDKKEQAPAQQ